MSATHPTDSESHSTGVRRETEDGTEYVVIPTTAQKEGVYKYPTAGGVSREYVAGEELTDPLDDWEGVPATLRHPIVNEDGEARYGLTDHSTARYTEVGEFRRVNHSTDDALKGEVWIPESDVDRYDALADYVATIEGGGTGEVSTGYDTGETVAERGRFNGQAYTAEQRDIRPDHVALLPDEPGNCSIQDGCGAGRANAAVRVNAAPVTDGAESTARVNILESARTPEYTGAVPASQTDDEFLSWSLMDYLDAYIEETGEEFDGDPYSALSSVPEGTPAWIADHTLLGSPDAETEENLLMFDVVGPDGQLYEERLLDILGPEGAQATIPEPQRESARDVAASLLDEAFAGSEARTNTDGSRLRQAWRDLCGAFRANADADDPADDDMSGEVSATPDGGDDPEMASDGGTDGQHSTTAAESAADDDTDTDMEDDDLPEKTRTLVEEYGFDADNLPDEETDCFGRIFDAFDGDDADADVDADADTESADDPESTETPEEPTTPETPGDDTTEAETATVNLDGHDSLDALIDARVTEALDDEKQSAVRSRQETAIVNAEAAPFDEDDLESMNADAVARIHDEFVASDDGETTEATSGNYAGVPSPTPTSRANVDRETAPVAGVKRGDTRGDDE